jgi:fimbrial chaperone protein
MSRRSLCSALAVAVILASLTGAARAQSSFSVDPLLIRLTGESNNAVLTISNPTAKEIRFEIKAFAWDQAPPNGTMKLEPTGDIVVFPPLVTLKPRMTQRVRIGTTAGPGPIEKSYRILIEELPSSVATTAVNQVTVRTRIGVPVFVEPTKATLSGRIQGVTIAKRVVSIALVNTGTTHAMVDNIIVRGMSAPDESVFEESLQGWYVLAGKTRTWEYTFKPAQCRPSKFVEIEVYAHDTVLKSRADVPAGACNP